ncbi:hypothetical protein MmiAt1_01820 [Methanimicrococcus sp. At1]|uniref:Uncharacterized protein n=1 Tax=Methanimicrococcus hacksteinii TaxID=3028293 RepID=A0ABU3VMS0_9EURY|nr:hypothetical protein [Methanimicrococcus sp. At1]
MVFMIYIDNPDSLMFFYLSVFCLSVFYLFVCGLFMAYISEPYFVLHILLLFRNHFTSVFTKVMRFFKCLMKTN